MSQVIIRRKAGQEMPEAFLKLALENCSKVWSASIIADGKIEIAKGTDCTFDLIQETLKDFEKEDITFFLGDVESASNLKDYPPYDMIANDDDEPLVLLLAEGNFPSFDKSGKGSSHPSIYHLAEHLSEEFFSAYDMCDKDLDKFMSAIEKDHFKKKMNLHSVSRGYITVLAQNGRAVTFGQGETDSGDKFPWGWASNTFGYGAKDAEPAKEEKKRGMFPRRSTVREKVDHQPSNNVVAAGADKAPPTETAVKAPATSVPVQPPKEKPVVLTIQNVKVSKVKIPEHLSRKLRANWIKERIGYKPLTLDDPKAVYEVYSKPDGTVLTRDELNKAFGMSASGLPKLENVAPIGSSTANEHIDPDKQVSTNPLPILSPNSREHLKSYISDERVKKIIGENATLVTDPDNIQSHEGKIAKLPEQLGMKDSADWDALPFVELEKIGKHTIHNLAVLAWNWKVRALSAEAKLGKKKKDEPIAAPAAEVQPEQRRGMFPRRASA